jgi:hypothetical protein
MGKKFKGPAARALDAWYSTGSVEENLTEARELLESPRDFTSIIAALSHGKPEFNGYPKSPWGSEFEDALRDGYLRAITLAFDHDPPVPIRTTWETGAGNTALVAEPTDGGDHVEVTVRLPRVQIKPEDEQQLGLTDVRTVD